MRYSNLVKFTNTVRELLSTTPVDDDFPEKMYNTRSELSSLLKQKSSNRKVVCLCGSTKFKCEYIKANRDETLKGNIVLSVGLFGHIEGLDMESDTKEGLDCMHLDKISISDEILVINKNGYIGKSTLREILFAEALGINIRYLEEQK